MSIVITGSMLSCNQSTENKDTELSEIIGRAKPVIEDGIMTPELLHSFGRVGSVEVSPDKTHILYQVTYVSITENKTNSELFIMKSDGTEKKQLTITNTQETNPQWIDNGRKIAFLSNETATSQIWTINPDGGGMTQVSHLKEGIEGFTYSPDGSRVLFIQRVKSITKPGEQYADLPKA